MLITCFVYTLIRISFSAGISCFITNNSLNTSSLIRLGEVFRTIHNLPETLSTVSTEWTYLTLTLVWRNETAPNGMRLRRHGLSSKLQPASLERREGGRVHISASVPMVLQLQLTKCITIITSHPIDMWWVWEQMDGINDLQIHFCGFRYWVLYETSRHIFSEKWPLKLNAVLRQVFSMYVLPEDCGLIQPDRSLYWAQVCLPSSFVIFIPVKGSEQLCRNETVLDLVFVYCTNAHVLRWPYITVVENFVFVS